VETFFVTNAEAFPATFMTNTLPLYPKIRMLDAQLGNGGHGTKMAIVAAGRTHGIAPNANLFLLKIKGQYNLGKTDPPSQDKTYVLQIRALTRAFQEIRLHVNRRVTADANAKSVINMSWGESFVEFPRSNSLITLKALTKRTLLRE
jgi:hypothetical protein